MRVKNLVPWAGNDFSVSPGEEIELADDVALARIEAGVAEAVDDLPAKAKKSKKAAEPSSDASA